MWSIGETQTEQAPNRPDCPGCGEPDLAGDDFCHECGHSFTHLQAANADSGDEDQGDGCPMCPTGELITLEYGRTQCDSCGYTNRDDG